MPLGQHVVEDYRKLGLSLKAHLVSFVRPELDFCKAVQAGQLLSTSDGAKIAVCGLVLVRQRPGSAKGVIFLTLEDESGTANVIVWTKTFEQYRSEVLGARLLLVRGKLQSHQGVIHLVAHHLEDKTSLLVALNKAHMPIQSFSRADEVLSPQSDRQTSKARVLSSLSVEQAVMSKGRNFC